jgi:hypothetical protein
MSNFFDNIFHEEAKDWVFAPLGPDQVPSSAPREPIGPNENYVSIFLRSARIVNVRSGLRRFYGVVHSLIHVPHRSGDDAEFAVVTVPMAMRDLDPNHLDRVVQLNHRLAGPVPYVGGDVQIEVGLLSVASSDLAAPYLQLLETLSKKAGVAYISSALPFADVITSGINLLMGGADKSILEIGFSVEEESPTTGWYVAVRASKDSFDVKDLKVDPSDNKLLAAGGNSLKDYPYLVIEVEKETARNDWFKIPELAQAYAAIQAEFRSGDAQATQEAITAFRRIALTNNDLLEDDAVCLAERLKERYAETGPPKPLHQRRRRDVQEFPALETLDLYAGR